MTLGNDNGTDGQTDRQSATQYAAPPMEEGRIKRWDLSERLKVSNDGKCMTDGVRELVPSPWSGYSEGTVTQC